MEKKDCKVGMKVLLMEDIAKGRLKRKRIGEVLKIYNTYALVRILDKYNQAFFFKELTEYKEEV